MACLVKDLRNRLVKQAVTERELKVERAAKDVSSLTQVESVYRRHSAYVYTLCLRLLGSESAAEEATVQVFVRLGRDLASRSCGVDLLSRLRDLSIAEALAARVPVKGAENDSHSVASRLPTLEHFALVLHDVEGMSYGDVAAHLGFGEMEVRRLVHEARLALAREKRLHRHGSGPLLSSCNGE